MNLPEPFDKLMAVRTVERPLFACPTTAKEYQKGGNPSLLQWEGMKEGFSLQCLHRYGLTNKNLGSQR